MVPLIRNFPEADSRVLGGSEKKDLRRTQRPCAASRSIKIQDMVDAFAVEVQCSDLLQIPSGIHPHAVIEMADGEHPVSNRGTGAPGA